MSRLFDKATQKVKKKVSQAVDRLRPTSQGNKAASPTLEQRSDKSANLASGILSPSSVPPAIISVAQSSTAAKSTIISPSPLSGLPMTGASLRPPEPIAPVIPAYARPPSPSTILTTTGSAVKALLMAARDGSDLFLPLKAALVGVVALWDIWDRTVEAKAEFTKLESKLVAFKVIAEAYQVEPGVLDESLQMRLKALVRAVQEMWEIVEKKQSRGRLLKGAQSSIDLSDIKALVNAITSLLEVFQFESSIAVEKRLGLIVEYLKRSQNTMKTIKSALGDNFVPEAADHEQPNYAGCMTGTRVGVLSQFIMWIEEDPMSIFWLAGMAGMGKTSIAVSLCRMLREDSDPAVLLGGGYFCSRSTGSIARKDVRRILPTLAVLLASQSPEFAEVLAAELESDLHVGHKPVVDQIDPLLRRPLATLATSSQTIVFLVDALDECSNEREVAELLMLLADFQSDAKVKFIFTSRPEMHIRGTPISSPDHSIILKLHEISVDEVASDIRLYIQGTLNNAAPAATWYTIDDINRLVQLSGGLFIFASTVLKYVLGREEDDDRQDRLGKVTSVVAKRTAATSSIDKIYEFILLDASQSEAVDEDELDRMRRVLACILTARASLSVAALAALIDLTPRRLRGSLERLHSLVYLPADDELYGLRTLHTSLGDYLFERGPPHIRIAATLGHEILARGCLRRFAQEDLCFNISRSRSSFEPNPPIVPDWISPSLIYACLHWAHHIDAAAIRSAFDEEIGRVFRAKFLFWLEVLSVLGRIGNASGLLRIAGSAVIRPDLSQFLRDANAFVASSHVAISKSAPHIYISALPFAAKDSLVYRDFAPLYAGIVSVTTFGINRHGSRLVTTLTGHESTVYSVAYSPDGRLLASASEDGAVQIWDTRTGEEVITLLWSDQAMAFCAVFSPHGERVVSGGEDGVVLLWSVSTGYPILPPMYGHTDWVQSVAFSTGGNVIASASSDATVRLWSSETGQTMSVLKGHTDLVNVVAFSPDGRFLASGSKDQTVRLWDYHTSEAIGDPLTAIEDIIQCIAFSPNGKQMAAGPGKALSHTRVWNLDALESDPIILPNSSAVGALGFSSDGSMLASAERHAIKFWDPQTGQEIVGSSLTGHSDWVYSIAFSPDGLFLASGSADCTVRIWATVSSVEATVQPLPAHSSSVYSVAVSSAGTFIVSGSADSSVRMWNASTGDAVFPPFQHDNRVWKVVVSPDDRLVASASKDQTVRLWNTQTGERVGEPLSGHSGEVNTIAFSPDARWLASGSDDYSVCLWDVATGLAAPFGLLMCNGNVLDVAFSPDGRLLAAADLRGFLHLWLSGTDQPARAPRWLSNEGIYSIAFSPDSQRIVTGGADKAVCIWDVYGKDLVFDFEGHTGLVCSVAYSPDGRYVVSASEDMTVRLWDVEKGDAVVTLFGYGDRVGSAVFTPDGRSIICGGQASTIHSWDVETALLLPSRAESDPLARLGCAASDDGWLVGPLGELLLWVPVGYRGHIQLPPCSMIIGSHRVVISADDGLCWGSDWTACWRNGVRSAEP